MNYLALTAWRPSSTLGHQHCRFSSLGRNLNPNLLHRAFPIPRRWSSSSRPTPVPFFARKGIRRSLFVFAACGSVYAADRYLASSALMRTAWSLSTGLIIALDYKINFRPEPLFPFLYPSTPSSSSESGSSLPTSPLGAIHARNATRLRDLLLYNGGLYLKIGQAIAMQSAFLPREYQDKFARFFDDAPQNEWNDVWQVMCEEFIERTGGKHKSEVTVEDIFGEGAVMEHKARASASVAQVHWARLGDGREVAIKVQKREIRQQVLWDLWTFKTVMWLYTKLFDIPLYSIVPLVSQQLFLETDFINEANNAERMAHLISTEPRLRDRVHIPKVLREFSTKRVMTTDWINGVRLWDKESIIKPVKQGGLGLRLSDVMQTMVDLFSAQIFIWGQVHCDPHPGNMFVRRQANGKSELVLIDHGLYVTLSPALRETNALYWRSLLALDNETASRISREWGVTDVNLFATAVLLRPYKSSNTKPKCSSEGGELKKKKSSRADEYELSVSMRKSVRGILGDGSKWPKELVFLGRCMRIVQLNNQFMGSPVNRIRIMGAWAARAGALPTVSARQGLKLGWWTDWKNRTLNYLTYSLVMLSIDLAWYISRFRQLVGWGGGMEDDLEAQLRGIAKEKFGVELNQGVFDG